MLGAVIGLGAVLLCTALGLLFSYILNAIARASGPGDRTD